VIGVREDVQAVSRMASSVRWAITSGSMPNSWTPARRSTASWFTGFAPAFKPSGRIASLA
jgi:hypothetical protein